MPKEIKEKQLEAFEKEQGIPKENLSMAKK